MSSCRVGSSAISPFLSLFLFLFPPPIFEERRISHPPFLFSSHVLATVGETRSCSIILLIIRILSLSLSLVNMVKWSCKLDRCVTYVRYNFKDIDS